MQFIVFDQSITLSRGACFFKAPKQFRVAALRKNRIWSREWREPHTMISCFETDKPVTYWDINNHVWLRSKFSTFLWWAWSAAEMSQDLGQYSSHFTWDSIFEVGRGGPGNEHGSSNGLATNSKFSSKVELVWLGFSNKVKLIYIISCVRRKVFVPRISSTQIISRWNVTNADLILD